MPQKLFILPPATAETTKLELQSAIVRSGRLRFPVICMAKSVVVKMAHELAIPCSLAAFPGDRNFCVTVAIRRPATDLIARQLVTCVSDHNCILWECFLCRQQQLSRDTTAKQGRMHCTCHNLPPEVSEEDGHSC